MWKYLQPGSSPVDWCEENYSFTPLIAEFVNTTSNILFFLMPPVLMLLFRDYGRFVNPAIHIVWVMLMIVGASSAYFHATLSLIGQLLDECAILWVFMVTFCMFLPRKYFPKWVHNDRTRLGRGLLIFTGGATCLAFIHPAINAFVLMLLGVPAIAIMMQQVRRMKKFPEFFWLVTNTLLTQNFLVVGINFVCLSGMCRETDKRVYRLGLRCSAAWIMSIVCWLNDRLLCDVWSGINFPYLHGLWHVLIFIASYTVCVLFAYFAVQDEKPNRRPVLKYWPQNDFELGIPYVTTVGYTTSKDGCIKNVMA